VLGNSLIFDNGTNVGIGTTSPASILEIREANRTNSSNVTNFGVYTTSVQGADIGGTIGLGGLFDGSNIAPFGSIRGGKENSTSGNYAGYLSFSTIPNNSNLVERMRITSAGDILVGLTSSTYSSTNRTSVVANGTNTALFGLVTGGVNKGYFYSDGTNILLMSEAPSGFMSFGTNNAERMRITSGGWTKISNNATYVSTTSSTHEMNSNEANWICESYNRNATPYGLRIKYPNASPNGNDNWFLYADDSTALRFGVKSNGGINNYTTNNVPLSDERLKKDITPLESVWDKIKGIEIVKYKFKDQTHDDFNMGVIAQQVQKIAPELVEPDGWGTLAEDGTTYMGIYESDIHYYSIKALQEAMAKIESLQAQINELKNK
jgi:hypothetical protein